MKLVIDLSDVLMFFQVHWTVTGIQRVALRVAKLMVEQHGGEHDLSIMAIDSSGRAIIGNLDCLTSHGEVDRSAFLQAFALPETVEGSVKDSSGKEQLAVAPKASSPWAPLRFRITAPFRIERRRTKAKENARPNSLPEAPAWTGGRLAGADELDGATILLLGGVRPVPGFWNAVQRIQELGVREIVMTIYDLIPLTRSELVADDQPDIFYESLHFACGLVNRFIAISEDTGRDLAAFHETYGYAGKSITVVLLAHEFVLQPQRTSGAILPPSRKVNFYERSGVQHYEAAGVRRCVRACRLDRYVLTVGTIEPRKNFHRLCRVWNDVLSELGPDATPSLVIAGKKSYGTEDFEEFLLHTGHVSGYVKIIDAPTDQELEFLYESSLFTIYPSLAEGYGLPVGESLWHGKYCLASRATSVPEVAGDLCDYFDPESNSDMQRALVGAIRDLESVQAKGRAVDRAALRKWSDVAEDYWRAVAHQDPVA